MSPGNLLEIISADLLDTLEIHYCSVKLLQLFDAGAVNMRPCVDLAPFFSPRHMSVCPKVEILKPHNSYRHKYVNYSITYRTNIALHRANGTYHCVL